MENPQDEARISDTASRPADIETPTQSERLHEQQDSSVSVRTVTDGVLSFLGTASNEKLGACLVGLGAVTYVVLGRLGLVLIGALGGVVLHATWEGRSHVGRDQDTEQKRRKEAGVEVAQRLLAWHSSRKALERETKSDDQEHADFSSFEPEIGKALDTLTDAVIRDYVRWWYSPVMPSEEAFPEVSLDNAAHVGSLWGHVEQALYHDEGTRLIISIGL